MNKLFSFVLATTILAATPLLAMDERNWEPIKGKRGPIKGVKALPLDEKLGVRQLSLSSEDFKAGLQHRLDSTVKWLSENNAQQELRVNAAKLAVNHARCLADFSFTGGYTKFLYYIGKRDGMAFYLEGQTDAELLLREAYGSPSQKCTLKELESVTKGAKIPRNPAERNLFCTMQENNSLPVLTYSVSENESLNVVVIPFDTDSAEKAYAAFHKESFNDRHSKPFEPGSDYRDGGDTEIHSQKCAEKCWEELILNYQKETLVDTHNVDLIIDGDIIIDGPNIPAGVPIRIKQFQGYFAFTPKTSGRNDRYRLSF